jgi:acyl carrier protein
MAGETLSGTERRVAEIYAAMLEVSDVSADDDIFSLGGDSLQAVRIALEIEREFNLAPTLERMEESSRIRDLAAWIDTQMHAGSNKAIDAGGR